ncbi:MAG: tape measure protein [Candidatus Poribacteria bacterium]|nr:tape measure protein [Candidatus Poribacteria bacterium]
MPTNTITFKVADAQARAGFNRLKKEVDDLDNELRDTQTHADRAGAGIDRLGDTSRRTATEVDRLGDTWQTTNRQLRDSRGRFASAGQGADAFARSLGGIRGIAAGLGLAVVGREILEFGIASVQAAGRMEGLRRGLEAIEGSNADERLRAFNDIAKLPGLNTPQIIRYSNSLRSAGATAAEVDAIIVSFGQSIVGLGGSAADTSRAMLQLTQAFGENKISQENFSTIKELIPSFNRLSQEVYKTDGSMDDLNKKFQASGQTLGQFLLPVLARLRQEIPAAPVDSYARSIDALAEEFEQFKIAIGTELLPVVSSAARGLASLFDTMTRGVQVVSDFFDVVDEEHQALLNASESASEFAARLADIGSATGQSTAVDARIQTLHRLRSALRTEQSALSDSSKEYFEYAKQIRAVANELDLLRAIRTAGTSDDGNSQLLAQRTNELREVSAAIKDYEQRLQRLREVAVGSTNASIQNLESLMGKKIVTAKALTREIELLKNGFQDFAETASTTATTALTNYSLALAKLKADAEDALKTLQSTPIFSAEVTPNFQAAINASNAYYAERIKQAETALSAETEGTEKYNELQTTLFNLNRQRLQEDARLRETQSRINIERTRQFAEVEKRSIEELQTPYVEYRQLLNSVIEIKKGAELRAYIADLRQEGLTFRETIPHIREYVDFLKQVAEIPRAASADAQYGNFISKIGQDAENTQTKVELLGNALSQVVQLLNQNRETSALDLSLRIPDLEAENDLRIANEARTQQTLLTIRQDAGEAGREYVRRLLQDEQRDIQRSIQANARQYRQFANIAANAFVNLVSGRAQNFKEVTAAFIQQSLRIVARAFIENQIRIRLDDTLTAHRIANIQKVNAAQTASLANVAGLGNLPGLGNLSGLGSSLSGGGLALGAASLLFPNQIRNLTGGISDLIGGLLGNIASVPDRAFGPPQVLLKLGDNEIKDITDIQDDLKKEGRL